MKVFVILWLMAITIMVLLIIIQQCRHRLREVRDDLRIAIDRHAQYETMIAQRERVLGSQSAEIMRLTNQLMGLSSVNKPARWYNADTKKWSDE